MVSILARLQEEVEKTISDLTGQTVTAWEQFWAEATTKKSETNSN